MNIQQCWRTFQKAQQLLEQGHWPEAHCLLEDVLHYIPFHINEALCKEEVEVCQFIALISTLRDASIAQSQILLKMGRQQCAFEVLNQSYCEFQFISIEECPLILKALSVLNKYSDDLVLHIGQLCVSQRSATWMLEFDTLQKSHHYFNQIRTASGRQTHCHTLN
ncbi:hypothetical protein [Vibrio genomosp. F10]|uniref:Uncharacterized protein n=2 Tax=Vibrio genomosp. F10 TaxID=723171 RepID=A0A1B9QX55_9VIBR|nr:hypothetical protein [Vibrio genomosp. F10]OCH74504.1 hypothetical protein A6E14_12650 [Vibrio genomosp. F10]OEE37443.1 hypothetical protein A1QO_17045 [Vibrio genomosp. F10 str. ZF-129]OEE92923.1 hypothetical protein A1QM_11100 [Vibrio genomosp. F10 str. 9ZC157]OEE99368.1 hypothetical protein A1QK_11935 [Vibrio genomosp. F10 str. 9ZD137]OEF07470.1 hypothetical protein A1QI_17115 [Vibrio genomosp. F10 str. 9ZB36]